MTWKRNFFKGGTYQLSSSFFWSRMARFAKLRGPYLATIYFMNQPGHFVLLERGVWFLKPKMYTSDKKVKFYHTYFWRRSSIRLCCQSFFWNMLHLLRSNFATKKIKERTVYFWTILLRVEISWVSKVVDF